MAYRAPNNVMVIGVGGTGKWILTYLKQSLIHARIMRSATSSAKRNLETAYDASIPDNIRLLCLDNRKQPVSLTVYP